MAPNGKQLSIYDPGDAEAYLEDQTDGKELISPEHTPCSSEMLTKINRKLMSAKYSPRNSCKGKI